VAGTTNKKVLVARFDRETLRGFVQSPGGFEAQSLELLTPEGALLKVPYAEIKVVCFVKDFDLGETWQEHLRFTARPKAPGLWLRLRFRGGDALEGMAPNNLLLVEGPGFNIIPPDPTFQNQRIFVPRAALEDVQVLGVIGSAPRRPRPAKKPDKEEDQLEMFEQG
jgi:hypothetical protein